MISSLKLSLVGVDDVSNTKLSKLSISVFNDFVAPKKPNFDEVSPISISPSILLNPLNTPLFKLALPSVNVCAVRE